MKKFMLCLLGTLLLTVGINSFGYVPDQADVGIEMVLEYKVEEFTIEAIPFTFASLEVPATVEKQYRCTELQERLCNYRDNSSFRFDYNKRC